MKITLPFFFLFPVCWGRPEYRDLIPNGHNVPNPCPDGGMWDGVGHENKNGGGARNPFGIEFFNNRKVWDQTLCEMDSDGDGRPNGMELGDPGCQWTPGTTPRFTTNITHPGICEPVTSPTCRGMNSFLSDSCLPTTVTYTTLMFTQFPLVNPNNTTPYHFPDLWSQQYPVNTAIRLCTLPVVRLMSFVSTCAAVFMLLSS